MTRTAPPTPTRGPIGLFLDRHYHHFNAGTLKDATDAYSALIDKGGKMMVTLAGAMSTARLGISLAEMIRRDKVQAITCTGANLEEDVFNLIGQPVYKEIPNYRQLTATQDQALGDAGMNRVTDVAIPARVMKPVEDAITRAWTTAQTKGLRFFPHEYLYKILRSGELQAAYKVDPKESWMLAAAQRNLPITVPGWEDSTLGNVFAAGCLAGHYSPEIVKGGIEYMLALAHWYHQEATGPGIGFFQIGGGIAGDFPICVVPLLKQDAHLSDAVQATVPLWSYFCQVSDAVTSYGGYSGATPNEKASWGKLDATTPAFVIESDASIVAPLMFSAILGH